MIGPEQHGVVIPAGWGFLHLHPSVRLGRHDHLPICGSLCLWHQGDSLGKSNAYACHHMLH